MLHVAVLHSKPNPKLQMLFPCLWKNSQGEIAISPKDNNKKQEKQFFNVTIELLERCNIQFTSSNVLFLGKNSQNPTDLLWNISLHHEYFPYHRKHVPELFKPFANVNDYVSQKKAKPRLSAKELQELVECLLGNLGSAKVISEIFTII